jgi:hypothetical protein
MKDHLLNKLLSLGLIPGPLKRKMKLELLENVSNPSYSGGGVRRFHILDHPGKRYKILNSDYSCIYQLSSLYYRHGTPCMDPLKF